MAVWCQMWRVYAMYVGTRVRGYGGIAWLVDGCPVCDATSFGERESSHVRVDRSRRTG